MLAVILVATALTPTVLSAPRTEPRPAAAAPKVAFIVGPVGDDHTNEFRESAEKGAAVARRYTPNVVTVYTPNATWKAAKKALQGASIVVYLGHGNGWPSKYRDSPYPSTQNGLGLNPVAGGDNDKHQYYGEAWLEREVKLAKNAVVLLHRLCYASGNTEPGLPEGTLDMSKQRVDNYAAGWIKSGAQAVVAEGQMGPAYYVEELLRGDKSIAEIWRNSPTFHGNVLTYASKRSTGYQAFVDPTRMDDPADPDGFYRSLVARPDATAELVRAGATRVDVTPVAEPAAPAEPTLRERGYTFGTPEVEAAPVAATTAELFVPVEHEDGDRIPRGTTLGVRWDPLIVEGPAEGLEAEPETEAAAPTTAPDTPTTPSDPDASPTPTPAASFAPVAEPTPWLVAESPGDVVLTESVRRLRTGLRAELAVPSQPGLYRVSVTLNDSDGVPYADGGVPYVAAQLVRVFPSLSVSYLVTSRVTTAVQNRFALPLSIANTGTRAWQPDPPPAPKPRRGEPRKPAPQPAPSQLVMQWVSLSATHDYHARIQSSLPAVLPGKDALVDLKLRAPSVPGDYLLLIDVVTPSHGSLAATGLQLGVVRVSVKPQGELEVIAPR